MNSKSFDSIIEKRFTDHICVFQNMMSSADMLGEIKRASTLMYNAVFERKALFFCGNGGSAADAQHIATEFISRFYHERRAINAEALTVNTSALTAISNDYDFERVFVRQLEARGSKGDVLVGISTSGTSRNVIKALEYASDKGINTILLTGGTHHEADESMCNVVIHVPSSDTPRIQEAHIFIGHILAEYIEQMIIEEEKE